MIGSAAAYLAGLLDEPIADVDLLTSARDAWALLEVAGRPVEPPQPSELFRSAVFGRLRTAPLPIEVMGELRLASLGWRALRPRDRIGVAAGGATLFIPSAAEQIRILRLFGRDKDMHRAERLRCL